MKDSTRKVIDMMTPLAQNICVIGAFKTEGAAMYIFIIIALLLLMSMMGEGWLKHTDRIPK